MFQTEFCGPDYKFLISWDTENCQNYSFKDNIFSDQDVFYKLNELYENISKFSTEFVECVKSVHGSTDLEELQNRLHENNPNVTFKIENVQNKQSSDEVESLRLNVDQLIREKQQLITDHENQISKLHNDFEQRTKQLVDEQNARLDLVKRELEDKYNLEMSDLRTYFEDKCTESLRHFTEESYQCSRDSDSDSYSEIEQDDENYEAINSTKFSDTNLDQATKDLQKILDKELKNIRKAYQVEVDKLKKALALKKDEEIQEMKMSLESKYTAKFLSLQSQLDRLLNEKNLENSVSFVYSQVKQDYETELNNLQNISDLEYASKLENDLILKHNEELSKRDQEWRDHVESSLSDIAVESALKSVIKETQLKSQSCHCSPSKKYKYKEIRSLKQRYKQEMDDLKHQFENELQTVTSSYDSELEKFNLENNALICQNKELLLINEKNTEEISSLKKKLAENVHLLQNLQENDIIDKIKDELSKMKHRYETEVSALRDDKYVLEKALDEVREQVRDIENSKRNIISSLYSQVKEFATKEAKGEEVVWPEELNEFRELLRAYESSDMVQKNRQNKQSFDEKPSLDISNGSVTVDDLEEILQQRETLRKVIVTLYSACEGFRQYIATLDDDRNATLAGELQKLGLSSSLQPLNLTVDDVLDGLNDTDKDILKKIQSASNTSQLAGIFDDETLTNATFDINKTFNQTELSVWFEKLKNDAAAILCLTSNKKIDVVDKIGVEIGSQTESNDVQRKVESLMEEISTYQEKYAKAQDDIDRLNEQVNRLNEKIYSMESLEGYGEGNSSMPERVQFADDGTGAPKSFEGFSRGDEFCSECDKLKEEAKRDRDDLLSQIEAASKKLKSLELFLERETAERESERDDFDKKVHLLQEQLKEKERDLSALENHAVELNTLEGQLRELSEDYQQTKIRNESLEADLASSTDKVWTLRDRNQELERKLAQKSELAESSMVRLKQCEEELVQLQQEYQSVRQELDSLQDNGSKQLGFLHEQHEISSAMIRQMKNQLMEVEKMVLGRTRELENNYVTVSSSNVASSPSEDVSVCDRIADRLNLASPCGSDMPVDLLVCLNEKLYKLFRAEDAALKRIRDHEMQINKLVAMLEDVQLEKDTLQESLNETTAKLSEAKIKLDNWQHRSNSAQSETITKLTSTIDSLQSQIEKYQKQITSKDLQLKELAKKIEHLNKYIKSAETEFAEKIRKYEAANENLQKELVRSNEEIYKLSDILKGHRIEDDLSLSTIVQRLLVEKNEQIHELEERLDVLKSLAEINDKSHSTEIENKNSSKRVNFTETLESYVDLSDHTRHAVVNEMSFSPKYMSINMSSLKKPLLGSSVSNESSYSLQPIQEIDESLGKPNTSLEKEITLKEDSIRVNLDDTSWAEHSPSRTQPSNTDESSKEQCTKLEEQLEILSKDLTTKKHLVEEMKSQLVELESLKDALKRLQVENTSNETQLKEKERRVTELTTLLETEKTKMREMNENYEKWFKSVVDERVQAQVKCEELARRVENLNKELLDERNKAEKLAVVVEKLTEKNVRGTDAMTVESNNQENVVALKEKVKQLEEGIEQAKNHIKELKKQNEVLLRIRDADLQAAVLQSEIVSSENGSLTSLTQQVQNEVDLAAMLDENMMQNLELGIVTSESFLDELRKLSPINADLRETLVKTLRGGFEVLNEKDKVTLRSEWNAFDEVTRNQVELLSNAVENLNAMLDAERKLNKEICEKNYDLQLQLNRLVTAHGYAEDRITFLAGKMNEYRDKAVKMEIESTTERTTRRQVELTFEQFKQKTAEKKLNDNKKLEDVTDQLNSTSNENLKLKQECGVLRNKIDSLIAELNSIKAITQYHSDSETELSRSLNPLKERIADIEEKYARMKYDYEKKKIELRAMRSNLSQERTSRKHLEGVVKEVSIEKHRVEKQLIDAKSKLEEMSWQKKKIEDKLNAAETAEVARRIIISSQGDTHRKELQSSVELQRKLQKECQEFQKNIAKLADELNTSKYSCKQIVLEAQRIFLRMLKAEHSQRSLIYQKNYLIVTLHEYESKCKTIAQSIVTGTRNHSHYFSNRISIKQKFRSYVFCMVSIQRMKFLNKRRIHSNCLKMKNYFISHVPEIAARNEECFDIEAVGRLM